MPTCGLLSVCCCAWFDDELPPESWWADIWVPEGPLSAEACGDGGQSLSISLGRRPGLTDCVLWNTADLGDWAQEAVGSAGLPQPGACLEVT